MRAPPCEIEQFASKIDIVICGHDHPDHLEDRLIDLLGNNVTWIVPLGLANKFHRRKVHNVVELDWWSEACISDPRKQTRDTHDEAVRLFRPDLHVTGIPAQVGIKGLF